MSWPLSSIPDSHLNKPTSRFLWKFFNDWEITSHRDLEMWHYDVHGGRPVTNLVDLTLFEGRDLYLLALYAGSEFPSLKHGYDKQYELQTVGSTLVHLDASRVMVCHPKATGFDQLLDQVIKTACSAEENIYGWYAFHDRMFVNKRRFRFGYEAILDAISVRALVLHADPDAARSDVISAGLSFEHCEALTTFGATQSDTAAGLAALIETIAAIKDRAQPECWRHMLIRRFSGLYAHLWRLQGHSMEAVITKLQERLQILVSVLLPGVTDHQASWIVRTTMACFIAPFPAFWSAAGIEVGDFLGCSLLDKSLFGKVRAAAYNTALDPFVRREGQLHQYPKLALDFLGKVDPAIYSPQLVDREGSRCTAWNKRVSDFADASDKVNALMERDIWHQALTGTKVADLLGEEAAIEGIRYYLQTGGKANQERAERLLQRYPHLADVFSRTITLGSEIKRFAAIAKFSQEQMQGASGAMRDAVFAVDLGL